MRLFWLYFYGEGFFTSFPDFDFSTFFHVAARSFGPRSRLRMISFRLGG